MPFKSVLRGGGVRNVAHLIISHEQTQKPSLQYSLINFGLVAFERSTFSRFFFKVCRPCQDKHKQLPIDYSQARFGE